MISLEYVASRPEDHELKLVASDQHEEAGDLVTASFLRWLARRKIFAASVTIRESYGISVYTWLAFVAHNWNSGSGYYQVEQEVRKYHKNAIVPACMIRTNIAFFNSHYDAYKFLLDRYAELHEAMK